VNTRDAAGVGDSPYVGLSYYTEDAADMFFGRDTERKVVIANLRASRLTLLYAVSGVGKSSLLRAGVASRLRELAIRSLNETGSAHYIPIVFNTWRDDPLGGLILEIEKTIPSFRQQYASIALPRDRLDHAIAVASDYVDGTFLIILDQFEEYLLSSVVEEPQGLMASELVHCISDSGLRANFLIAIREDAYARLGDTFKGRIANVYGNYLHLEYLDRNAAREAIGRPVERFNALHSDDEPYTLEPELIEAVLNEAQVGGDSRAQGGGRGTSASRGVGGDGSDKVETPLLQLVMTKLWEHERSLGSHTLRLSTLDKDLRGAKEIVRLHLDDALGGLSNDERHTAFSVFRQLVTSSRTKIAHSAPDLAGLSGLSEEKISEEKISDLLEKLPNSRIVRPVPPPLGTDGATRYEIYHDVLADAILDWLRRQAERVAQHARTRARIFLSLAIGALVLAVMAGSFAWYALNERQAADNQSRLTQSEELATEATGLLATNAPLGMLVSLQAYKRAHTIDTRNALIKAAEEPLDATFSEGRPVKSVAFSPDGLTLAVGDNDGHVGLWNLTSRKRTGTLIEGSPVESVAFSPNGQTLAVGDESGNVGLWNLMSGTRSAPLNEGSLVESVAFSPNGQTLAVGDNDGHVGLWNPTTGARITALDEGSSVHSIAFNPNGQTLAAGDDRGHVGLWNLINELRDTTLSEGSPVQSVTFNPSSQTLVVGDKAGGVGVWNLTSRKRTGTLPEGSLVESVAFSPNGQTLAVGDFDGVVGLWDMASGARTTTMSGDSVVSSVAFSPNGQTLAVGDDGGDVDVWDTVNGALATTLLEGSPVESVAFSPNGQTLAVGDESGDVGLWNLMSGTRSATLSEGSPVQSVAISPNGESLAAGDGGDDVGLWDVMSGTRTATLPEGSPVESVAFSPNGRTVAVGDEGGRVGLWSLMSRTRTAHFPGGSQVNSIAFSPNGQTLAVGDDGGHVDLWNASNRTRIATLPEGSPVESVAFSPNGRTVAVGDNGGDVGLWQTSNGTRIATLSGTSLVNSVAFSPTGQILAVGDFGGAVEDFRQSLWDPNFERLTHLVCGEVRRNMTRAQCG